jgi:hypothetical protein
MHGSRGNIRSFRAFCNIKSIGIRPESRIFTGARDFLSKPYLVDDSSAGTFDKKTVNRIQELQSLPAEEQNHVFAILDAFLRDAKTRSAYATS